MLFNNSLLLLFLKFYWSIVDLQCCVSGTQQSDSVICSLVAKSCPTLCDPVDYICQAPLSTGFPRQEYWSRSPFSSARTLQLYMFFFLLLFSESFLIRVITDYQVEFPMLYGSSFLIIYLIHSGVCVCVRVCMLSGFSQV